MYFQKVMTKKTKKTLLYVGLAACHPLTKKAGSGTIRQWYVSADPEPSQNGTDTQQ
jgi:hypothetical protein